MNILAIIPARGDSKGIVLKNIRNLAGKPLIIHTINSVKKYGLIKKIVVSTDNQKIANIAKLAGAEVPFLRPRQISQDNTPVLTVIKHCLHHLSQYESYIPDIILLLQPTSPLRTPNMIKRSISLLKNSNATCVLGVSKVKTYPYSSFWYRGKYLKPFISNFEKFSQRQARPTLYYPTGSIYTFWYNNLIRYNSIYGPNIKPLIIQEENNIDIDTKFDFFISEMVISHWKKYSKNFANRR